ncbi:MAG TPA: cache domain-containing protein, partial [Anaerolineaceae bacterium]
MIQSVISLFQNPQSGLIFPNHVFGWLGWAVLAASLVYGCWKWWEGFDLLRRRWWLALILLLLTPVCAGFLGIRLPGKVAPIPEMPLEVLPPALMFLAAIPWVLAAGLLGSVPAAVLGVLAGLTLGYFETRSPFTPLEIGGMALLFAAAIRQNYRTRFFRIVRHPIAAALLVIAIYIPVLALTTLLSTNESLAVRLDYAFNQIWLTLAARAGEVLIAGLVGEIILLTHREWWGNQHILVPSPVESSIQARFFFATVPLVTLLVLALITGDWLVAGNAARRMIQERLSSTAEVASESIPYFLETGQNLILTMATPDLLGMQTGNLPDALAKKLRSVPYFHQLFLFDSDGDPVSGHPVRDVSKYSLTAEEQNGIKLALKGVSTQVYMVPPLVNETSAQLSFIAAIRDDQSKVRGVLLGRTDLSVNPFIQPAIQALSGMKDLEGEGMILNENGQILYHSVNSKVMTSYVGIRPDRAEFFDATSPSNTHQFVYYQPVMGRPWAVVLTIPAKQAQQIALDIAAPLLIMLLVFSVLVLGFLRFSLRTVTSSLHDLAQEAAYISKGQLDRPLKPKSVDEIGQLSVTFEQMRVSLKSRLEELKSLLTVSEGVAANLDIGEAVRPILTAALVGDACSVRLVFVRDVTVKADDHGPVAFGVGPASSLYASFDAQLFDLARQQEMISLPNVARTRRLQFPAGAAHPGALLALAVDNEDQYYGVMWVAYDHPHNFSEEEIRFISTRRLQFPAGAAH